MRAMLQMITRLLCALALIVIPVLASAESVPLTLQWEANTESDLAGYRVYCSPTAGQYGAATQQVGLVTTWTTIIQSMAVASVRYCVLTAFDTNGNESQRSNEVSKIIPAVLASVLTAPENFVAVTADGSTTLSWSAVPDSTLYILRVHKIGTPYDPCESMAFCGSVTDALSKRLPLAPGEYDAWVHAATSPLVFGPSTGMKFIVAPPVDVPPEPPKGLIISESSPSEIVVIASVTDCPSIRTSTKGSTAIVLKRTVRCVPP